MRLFFSLTFDNATKRDLATYQELLCAHGYNGRNTRQDNLHLTLAFIGECTDEHQQKLIDILHQLHSGCDTLRIDRLGSFRQKRNHLIWLGFANNRALMRVQRELSSALKAKNFPSESKNYTPHITLLRHAIGHASLKDIHIKPRNIHVHSIALMESVYRENKLVYHVVDEIVQ